MTSTILFMVTRVLSWKSEADKTDFLKFSEIKLVTSRAETVKAKQHENISNETALMTIDLGC